MLNQFSREELIIGKENVEKLHNSTVAVFGLGGVGSFVVEGLARAGIGNFILIDDDKICLTNLNRQIHPSLRNQCKCYKFLVFLSHQNKNNHNLLVS